jgi:hypothetical protein
MVLFTEQAMIDGFQSLRGVKSARIEVPKPGKVLVTIRYKFWTYLWFGLNKKASKRVKDFINENRPFNVSMSMRS